MLKLHVVEIFLKSNSLSNILIFKEYSNKALVTSKGNEVENIDYLLLFL